MPDGDIPDSWRLIHADNVYLQWQSMQELFKALMEEKEERRRQAITSTVPLVNLPFLAHILQLSLTTRHFKTLRLAYENGKLTLADLRNHSQLVEMVQGDQKTGQLVGPLAYLREETVPVGATTAGMRGMNISDERLPRDKRNMVVVYHSVNSPHKHPLAGAVKQPVVNFPECGKLVVYENKRGRIVCKAHHKGICRKCNTDYAGIALFKGIDESNIYEAMHDTDEDGRPYPVFERNSTDAFAELELTERIDAYPVTLTHDTFFDIPYNASDPLSVMCSWGNSIRYVPQWDPAVVKEDEAELAKIKAKGTPPDKLLPIKGVMVESCEACQVNWLVPKYDFHVLMLHPSHHNQKSGAWGAERSMVVHVKGVLLQGNSTTGTPPRASVGVLFRPGSVYNIKAPFTRAIFSQGFPDDRNTGHPGVAISQTTPAFAAVVLALRKVREKFLDARHDLIEKEGRYVSGQAVRDAHRFRIILVTDSRELVDSLSSIPDTYQQAPLMGETYEKAKAAAKEKARAKKKRDKGKTPAAPMEVEGHVDWEKFTPEDGVRKTVVISKVTGVVVANCDGILAVMRETMLLNILGIEVVYYLQPASVNLAEPLAKDALGK